MSVVLITSHNESIYNVTKRPDNYAESTEVLYKSGHKERIKNERQHPQLFKEKGTMGPQRVSPPIPTQFLRKRTGKLPMYPPAMMDPDYGKHKCSKDSKTPPVPPRDVVLKEQDEKLIHPKKNFISKNVKFAVEKQPKEPVRQKVIDRDGTTKKLSAGEQPEYIYSKGFGSIPRYLEKLRKIKTRQEQAKKDNEIKVQLCTYIRREEREKLLEGLKQNWEELQYQYQGLPILTDTLPKISRKSKLEAALKQLEKDIVTVERHPYIYVYDDEDF